MTTYFICVGSVRGRCGRKHRTIEGAVRCQKRDQAACKRQGGYSDRDTRAVRDGTVQRLTEEEYLYSLSDECARRAGR